jgi:DNA repair protein RadA/Sms
MDTFPADKLLCPSCNKWNIAETITSANDGIVLASEVLKNGPRVLERISIGAYDDCFGKPPGMVKTSVAIIGGAPGAGKSTMALQVSGIISTLSNMETIYIGVEENPDEISDRATRIGHPCLHLLAIYPMGNTVSIEAVVNSRKPAAIVLDSLQGLTEDVNQQVVICKMLKGVASKAKIPVIIISQINKDNDLAGLMALQHAGDTIITLFPTGEGEIRLMETAKNRFGPANVRRHLEMTEKGIIGRRDLDDDFIGENDDE